MAKDFIEKKFIYILLFSITWGISAVITKYAINIGTDSLNFMTWTYIFSVIVLFLCTLLSNKKELITMSIKRRAGSMGAGALGNGFSIILSTIGLTLTSVSNYGFLLKTSIAFGVIFAFIFLREPLGRLKILFLILMLIGSYLISTNGALIIPNIGDLLMIGAAIFNAISTTLNKFLMIKKLDAGIVSFHRMLAGLVIIALFTFLYSGFVQISNLSLILSLICGLLLAMNVFYLNKTLEIATASYATLMSTMVPVIILVLSIIFLHEKFQPLQYLGAIVVLLSAFGIVRSKTANQE